MSVLPMGLPRGEILQVPRMQAMRGSMTAPTALAAGTTRIPKTGPTQLASGTHVVFDTYTRDHLVECGAVNVVRAADSLKLGPSRRDPQEHTRVRRAWRASFGFDVTTEEEEWDKLYASDVRWETPVIVWVGANASDTLNLWRTCHRLSEAGISYRDVRVLQFGAAPASGSGRTFEGIKPPRLDRDLVAFQTDEVLWTALGAARSWPRARFNRAVRLWEEYVDADPRPFARSCRRGVAGFPELADVFWHLSPFYPRQSADGGLRLSRFDELLLRRVTAEWQTAVEVYIKRFAGAWESVVSRTGDLFVPRRLDQWAAHATSPAVEREPRPGGGAMSSFVYRLTARGAELRAGLAELSDAPPLPVGGAEAYGGPWVLRDGRLARL